MALEAANLAVENPEARLDDYLASGRDAIAAALGLHGAGMAMGRAAQAVDPALTRLAEAAGEKAGTAVAKRLHGDLPPRSQPAAAPAPADPPAARSPQAPLADIPLAPSEFHPEILQEAPGTSPTAESTAQPRPAPPPLWQGRISPDLSDEARQITIHRRNEDGTYQTSVDGGPPQPLHADDLATLTDVSPAQLQVLATQAGKNQTAPPGPTAPPQAAGSTHPAEPKASQAPAPAAAPRPPDIPPLWQGTARHGEAAEVLRRNPDGTYQVRRNGGPEETFKEAQVAAMTRMQKPELHAHMAQALQRQEAAVAAAGQAGDGAGTHQGLPPAADNRLQFSQGSTANVREQNRLQFSQSEGTQGQSAAQLPRTPGQAMQALAENENRFRRGPASGSKDLGGIVQEYELAQEVDFVDETSSIQDPHASKVEQIHLKNGGNAYLFHAKDGTVWMDRTEMRVSENDPVQGGDLVTQAFMTYAHNNGLRVRPDPLSVSDIAQQRDLSHMLSSALRHRTTQHLMPNGINLKTGKAFETMPGWREGDSREDFDHNVDLLARAEYEAVRSVMQTRDQTRLEDLHWDPQDDTVTNVVTGRRLSERDFKSIVSGLDSGNSGVGATTLSRALVARQALQSNDSQQNREDHPHIENGNRGGGILDQSGSPVFRLLDREFLFYSQPDGSGVTLGTALGSSEQLGQTLAETTLFLNQKQPGLINEHTHLFTTVEALLASDYARQHPFTAEQIASLRTAEGFHDSGTGHSIVIAENTRLLPGESPQDAITRVVLHERVGHSGLQVLLGHPKSARSRRWAALSEQIPQADLDAIAGESQYQKIAGDRSALAYEWFARRTEKDVSLLKKGSLPRQMWDAFREMVMDFMASTGRKPTLGRSFETQVKDLQRRARNAALRPATKTAGNPNSHGSQTGLQFSQRETYRPSSNPPPLWQGTARHGEAAEVLRRNPDGTYQVRRNGGPEETFNEAQVATMTRMQKPELHAHMAQALQRQEETVVAAGMAESKTPQARPLNISPQSNFQKASLNPAPAPPLWKGAFSKGDHGPIKEIIVSQRNADGTYQAGFSDGPEVTLTSEAYEAMTGLKSEEMRITGNDQTISDSSNKASRPPTTEWHVPPQRPHEMPKRPYNEAHKPSGPRKVLSKKDAHSDNIRATHGENEAADVMARYGYDIEQIKESDKSPDLRINQLPDKADVYSPAATTSLNNIRAKIIEKVDDQNAPYVIIRLDPGPASHSASDIAKHLQKKEKIKGLKQVFVIKDNKLFTIY